MRSIASLAVLAGLVGSAPVSAAQAASAPSAEAIAPAMPGTCDPADCATYVLNVPVAPTDAAFGSVPNSTVDLRVDFPAPWTALRCGDDFGVVVRDGSGGDGLAIPRWTCRPSGRGLHFSGPSAKDSADAPVRFLFRAVSGGPSDPLTAVDGLRGGFIDLTQTYLDGEQQRLRAPRQFQFGRLAESAADPVTVRLPAFWLAPTCFSPTNLAGSAVSGWTCALTPDVGPQPRFTVRWTNAAAGAARDFQFLAYSSRRTPLELPLSITAAGPVGQLRDLRYNDGQIQTVLLAHLRPGFRKPKPSPSATSGYGSSQHDKGRRDCTPYRIDSSATANVNGNPAPAVTANPTSGNVTNNFFGFGNNPGFSVNQNTTQFGVDPNCVAPNVIVDPCAGAYFGRYGHGRFGPRRDDVPSACYGPFGDRRERPSAPEPVAVNRVGEHCIPSRNHMGRPLPPGEFDRLYGGGGQLAPPVDRPPMGPGNRADRSYARVPLKPAADPNDPPVLLVSPEDGSTVQRAPGSNDDRVIVAPPNANPRPSIRALLPESQQGGGYVPPQAPPMDMPQLAPEAIPYCEEDLPATGADGSTGPVLKMAVGALGIGVAMVLAAVYWRRNAPRHDWYSGGA
ncbi:MAG: hypothetical protein ACT4QG_01970 [Sporichthyaceae bacterium]